MKCKDCDNEKAPGRSRCWPCYYVYRNRIETEGPKTLVLDIETSPIEAYVWGLWNQNVSPGQIIKPTRMLSFAAKWVGDKDTEFFSEFHDGKEEMVAAARSYMHQADIVIHYNGNKFDTPHVNREILQAGIAPPSPFKAIDLYLTAKKQFKWPSNKLDSVAVALGLDGKVKHEGFELWKLCLAGDKDAWGRMREYNMRDVTLTEELYHILLPWIPQLPNRNLYDGTENCPICGDGPVLRDGFAYTTLSKFKRWHCEACGAWLRSSKREHGVTRQQLVR